MSIQRLDPGNRRRVEALLRDRPRRLAVLNSHAHRSYWPQKLDQMGPMTRAMADEQAAYLGDDHPHVRWLRGEAT